MKFKVGDYVKNKRYKWIGVITDVNERGRYFVEYLFGGCDWEEECQLSIAINGDYIRDLSNAMLAERLISSTTDDEGISCYQLPQGGITYGYEEAIEITTEWLREAYKGDGINQTQ
jgi:hypothetical protein